MKIERYMKVRAAKGLDILIVGKTPLEVSEQGMLCEALGYKPRLLLQTESKTEWYQWWYLPKKRQPRTAPSPERWSARREGLQPMKG